MKTTLAVICGLPCESPCARCSACFDFYLFLRLPKGKGNGKEAMIYNWLWKEASRNTNNFWRNTFSWIWTIEYNWNIPTTGEAKHSSKALKFNQLIVVGAAFWRASTICSKKWRNGNSASLSWRRSSKARSTVCRTCANR
jgi:hypothetical protein